MIISEEEADWRYSKVLCVNGDQVVWGQFVKDGTLGWLTSNTEAKLIGEISFPTPDPAALAFSIAFDSARAAGALWKQVSFTGKGKEKRNVRHDSVPALYAYFEQSMTAAVFSFQCVEAYANHKISDLAKEAMDVPRKDGNKLLTPAELERKLSTEEKLSFVLPKLMSIKSPKGTTTWALFRELKRVRDSTVHLKSADQYVRNKIDRESIYFWLLKHAPISFPQTAAKIVRYFCRSAPERWLEVAESRLAQVQS